ncbi:MAG TPA: YbjN domain-containing protein [Acidimicrobiia bacterium]|nr:YbjN domain-containing protein [Acidimicrobiia bacterium]
MVDDAAGALVADKVAAWVDDPESDVEYAEQVEGRWAVRMRQTVRDATTVWFWIGDRTLIAEAYVLPAPPVELAVYRLALRRNGSSFRVNFALDREGALVLRSRIPLERLSESELEYLLADFYQTIEVSFRALIAAGFEREKQP